MGFLPAPQILFALIGVLVIVGAIFYPRISDDTRVLGQSNEASQSAKNRLFTIVSEGVGNAASEIREKTSDLVTEQAAKVVVNEFDELSDDQKGVLKEQICESFEE